MELPITKAERNLKRVGGFLGVFQGSTWLLMALICIVMYNEGVDSLVRKPDEEYGRSSFMYALFITGIEETIVDQIITPRAFTIFMWGYLILDFFWILASFNVINKNKRNVRNALKSWNIVTFLICVMDLTFVILLGLDYYHCLDDWFVYLSVNSELEAFCFKGILPVLIIVAKGFILWFVNVVFIVIFFKVTRRLKDKTTVQVVRPCNEHMGPYPSMDLGSPFPTNHNGNELPRVNGHVRTSYEYQSVVFAPFTQ